MQLLGLSPQDCYVFRGKYRYEDVVIRWQQRLGIAGEEQIELMGSGMARNARKLSSL